MNYKNTKNSSIFLHDIGIEIAPLSVVSLNEQQIEQSSVAKYLIEKGILIEVSDTESNVILPGGITLNKEEFGQVLVPGKFPGTGQLKSIEEVVTDSISKVQEKVQDVVEKIKVEESKKVDTNQSTIPEDIKNWINLRHALKKFDILRCADPSRLKYI
ncbi:MAG: hypothetical protein QXD72_02385, partial [Candidatus Aenigmatarchaeota archaeon]